MELQNHPRLNSGESWPWAWWWEFLDHLSSPWWYAWYAWSYVTTATSVSITIVCVCVCTGVQWYWYLFVREWDYAVMNKWILLTAVTTVQVMFIFVDGKFQKRSSYQNCCTKWKCRGVVLINKAKLVQHNFKCNTFSLIKFQVQNSILSLRLNIFILDTGTSYTCVKIETCSFHNSHVVFPVVT